LSPWRVAIGYVAASALAAALVLTPLVPLWQTWFGKIGSFRDLVSKNVSTLTDLMQRDGPATVASAVRTMASEMPDDSIILFAGPGKEILAGTLREWPAEIPDVPLRGYGVPTDIDVLRPLIIVSQEILPGGYRLLMARKAVPQRLIDEQLLYGVAGALAVLIVLGAGAAWLLARRAAAARQSEGRYALAMQAAGDGHTDWDLQTGEHYISPRLLEICGYAPGTTFRDRAEWVRRFPFHPEDRPVWERAVAAHFAGRESHLKKELRIVVRGEVRWTAFHFLSTRDDAGKPIRWTGSIGDITEYKRAEETVREQTERLQLGQAAMRMIIMDWNVAEDLLTWSDSPEWLRGPMPASGRYPFFKDQVHPDDRDSFVASRSRALETLQVQTTEFRLERTDGEVIWVLERKQAFAGEDGKAVRMLAAMFDITDRKRAEAARRLSEERYALAMEASEVGHFDWNVQTDEIFASDSLKVLLGLPSDFIFRTRSEMLSRVALYAGDAERVTQITREVLTSSATHHEFEYRWDRGSGGLQWNRVRWKIFRREDGTAVRVVGTVSDVTERKKAADELRESEARFRGLTELWSDWYWRQDEQLIFTYSSAAIDPPRGYPGGSAIGKTRWELPGIVPLSCTWAAHRELLAARKPFRDFEYSRPGRDGALRYVSSSGTPIFDENGHFRGYHGVGRDITERKRVEEELRSRQEMLEVAQKAARVTAFEWKIGASEGENRWSPDLEAIYGFAPGTYDGSFEVWKKAVHAEDWPAVEEAIARAQRTGDVAAEYRVVHPDGSLHWLQARGRMFSDAAGHPARMVGFMQDITQSKHAEDEMRKLEQELRRAQRLEAMGTLAGGIAHDFNNILGAILGYGEMALRNTKKGSRLRHDLDAIISAGDRGRSLVERILAFSRSGVGERVPVHVEAVVHEALDQIAVRLPANVTITQRLHGRRAAVLGDPTQVHQVVMNLASNAVHAMPEGGVLHVVLDTASFHAEQAMSVGSVTPGDYIVFGVSDTGSGIPNDVLERMFDPFFTTKEVGVGNGLGLSLVHGIVTNAGGAIDVTTELDKGSTFTVYLRRAGVAPEKQVDESLPPQRGKGQRVLVVDDEEPLMRLAIKTLEHLGYAAVGFTSSTAALAAFRADPQRFDAVLTDERMPGMSGATLIREVRGIRGAIPVVLMSGYLGMESVDADLVLRKPLSARDLAASIAEVMQL